MRYYRLWLLLATILMSTVLVYPALSSANHSREISPGCYNHKCAREQCQKSAACKRRTRPKPKAREASALSPLAACIIRYESGGNPMAQNHIYKGIAQWSPTIWRRDGGLRFGPTPFQATYAEQVQVLMYGLIHHGCGDWCPYDPAPEAC